MLECCLKNAALFLQLGLTTTLIRHENGAFRKTLFKPEEFENAGWTENVLKTGRFEHVENDGVTIIDVISLPEFSSNANSTTDQ